MNKDPEHPSRIVDRYLSKYRTESSLGQNFLIEPFPIQASSQASRDLGLEVYSHVLEIGPGPGVLSIERLRLGSKVTAIEISQDVCDFLDSELNHERFNLLNGDALSVQWPENITHVVANIPYGISSPIIERIQEYHQSKPLMGVALLVQREFAQRSRDASLTWRTGAASVQRRLHIVC